MSRWNTTEGSSAELHGINPELAAAAMVRVNHRKKLRNRLFGSVAAVVVFITTYMLILPALTLSSTPVCGLEEHTHTEACYTTERTLTCGLSESAGHTHTADCYDADGNVVCGQSEAAGHTHGDACYTENRVLTCTLPEHVHTDACYPAAEEAEAEEASAEETTDDPEEDIVIPIGDSTADRETAADWEATLADVELTGNWGADTIAIAKTQLGYHESTKNFQAYADEDGKIIKKGYNRYAAWYHNGTSSYGDWCAMFCSFCYHYAEVPEEAMPEHSGVPAWIRLLNQRGQYHGRTTGYIPSTGNLIFYDWEQDGTSDHVALVEYVSGGRVYTIEGNFNDEVAEADYALDDSRIMGYGELPENPDYEEETTEAAEAASEETVPEEASDDQESFELTASTADGITVTVSGAAAALPYPVSEVTLTVKRISDANAVELAEAAGDSDVPVNHTVLEISLWHHDEEIEPDGEVTITISSVDLDENSTAQLYHISDDGTQAEKLDTVINENGEATAETDSFSTYVYDTSHNFADCLTDATVTTRPNTWSASSTITPGDDGKYHVNEGDLITFSFSYVLPGGMLNTTDKTIYMDTGLKLSTEKSGNVYNSSGNPVGTYVITVDGQIAITFDDEYAQQSANGQAISGTISFECKLEDVVSSDQGEASYNLNDEITLDFTVDNRYFTEEGFTVQKQGIANSDGTITYTVVVSSSAGTGGNAVTITDTMSGNLNLDGAVSVQNHSGSTVSFTKTDSDHGFGLTLPAMSAGESYTITYTAKLADDASSDNKNNYTQNSITSVHEGDDGKKYKTTASVYNWIDCRHINKSGKDNGDGTITWTIYVNQAESDIAGYALKDSAFSDYTHVPYGAITITHADGSAINSSEVSEERYNGQIVFKAGSDGTNTNSYKITYTYDVSNDNLKVGTTTYKNTATLEGDNIWSSGEISIGVNNRPANKSYTSATVNADGTMTLHWSVTVAPKVSDLSNMTSGSEDQSYSWSLEDSTNGYYTKAQLEAIKTAFAAKLEEVTGQTVYLTLAAATNASASSYDVSESSLQDGVKYAKFQIKSSTALSKGQSFTFDYDSTADISGITNTSYFTNTVSINGEVNNTASYTYTPILIKSNASDGYDSSTQVYSYDSNGGVLKWNLKLTVPSGTTGAWTLYDALPAGLIYDSIAVVEYWTLSSEKYSVSTSAADDGGTNVAVSIPDMSFLAGQTVNFTLTAKLEDAPAGGTTVVYRNQAYVKDQDGQEIGASSAAQNVSKKDESQTLKKTASQKDNIITYQIELDPSKVLNDEDDTISYSINDVMKYACSQNGSSMQYKFTLVPGSVKLTVKSTGLALPESEYTYTYSESELNTSQSWYWLYDTLDFTVHSDEPLILEYQYLLTGDMSYATSVTNTVKLNNGGTSDTETSTTDFFMIDKSAATANTHGISIIKVDSENSAARLAGAKFQLYAYNSTTGDYDILVKIDGIDYGITNETGTLTYESLTYNNAYMLVETEAPAGYQLNEAPLYFYIANSDTTTYPMVKPANFSGTVTTGGAVIYFKDVRKSQDSDDTPTTSVTISKKWFDADSNDTTASRTTGKISFDLYQLKTKSAGASGDYEPYTVTCDSNQTLDWTPYSNGNYYYYDSAGSEYKQINAVSGGMWWITITLSDGTSVSTGPEKTVYDSNLGTNVTSFTFYTKASGGDASGSGVTPEKTSYTAEELTELGATKLGTYELYGPSWTKSWSFDAEDGYTYTYYVIENDSSNYVVAYEGQGSDDITIQNTVSEESYELPSTGGTGTTLFTAFGLLLMAFAMALGFGSRRRRRA